MSYPPIPQRKACDCSDPCISTDDVYYSGPNLPNSGINTNNILTLVIEKLDAIYAVPTLQRVTEMGNYTTLPIIADSFVKIGGDGTNLLLDDGTVLPIGDLPTGVTETSQLINDGEDGINPFITALDIPAFNPSDYDLDEFTNLNVDPFAHLSDIPAPLGYVPVNKAGDTMLGDLILNQDPSTALQAATKQYVDNIVSGINFHPPVVVATDVSLVATYDNGLAGVGATLTGPSVGVLSIDGETPTYLQRILVWQQADPIQNGVYDLTTVGDSVTVYQLTRSSDADNSPPGEIHYGDYTLVLSGDTNGGFGFICNTPGTIDIGITPINYIQFNAAQAVTAGYGLQEAVSNVISIDPLVTQEKIILTTTGSGAATLVSNTLNIPQADNYWTKTGNDISNNNSGSITINPTLTSGLTASLIVKSNGTNPSFLATSSTNTPIFRIDNANTVYCAANINCNAGFSIYYDGFNFIKLDSGNGVSLKSWSYTKADGKIKYLSDYSSTYDDRTLVDKGYITTYTTAQLAGKMNNPSLTASYIPKALTATTIGDSRLWDTGTTTSTLGIGVINTPLKDISLGYQADRVIGIEDSESTTVGRNLTVGAGRAINFLISGLLVDSGISIPGCTNLFGDSSGNVYASTLDNGLYKQTGGIGAFAQIGSSSNKGKTMGGCVAPNGDVYMCTLNAGTQIGDIYKQVSGTTTFVALGQTPGTYWRSMCATPNGDVYASVSTTSAMGGTSGDIYKQASGTTGFVAMGFPARNYSIGASPNGDVFAAVAGGSIYKISNGTTVLTDLVQTARNYYGITTNGTDVYVAVLNGDIWKQTNNTGTFQATGQVSRGYYSLLLMTSNILYAGGYNISNLFTVNLTSLGTSNLQGGTLKLTSGTGKGTGASDIELYTGQVLASGTDMQTSTLRAKINNTGLMTLPSVTNALIEADSTGRAVVTKEYVNNRLVVETASPYTLTNADSGGIVIFTASTTLTIPTGLADGFECTFVTLSGVTLTVVSTGNTLNNATSTTMLPQLSFTLKRMLAANTYIVAGSL